MKESDMITEQMICNAGLYPYQPDMLAQFPESLHKYCGRGLGLWQYPNQFAPYLNKVLENKVDSYLEIGVGAGGTFTFTSTELIKAGCRSCFAVDVAPIGKVAVVNNEGDPFEGKLAAFIEANPECSFHQGTGTDFLTSHRPYPVDFALIDGDHSYAGVTKDWLTVVGRARIIAIHDISNQSVPGVGRFWNEIKNNRFYHSFEFTQQYEEGKSFLGIGLMIQKQVMSGGAF